MGGGELVDVDVDVDAIVDEEDDVEEDVDDWVEERGMDAEVDAYGIEEIDDEVGTSSIDGAATGTECVKVINVGISGEAVVLGMELGRMVS